MGPFIYFSIFLVFFTKAKKSELMFSEFHNKNAYLSFLKLDAIANITLKCPTNTSQSQLDNKLCYLFVNGSKTFDEAESFCNQSGGNLAVVPNQFINQHLSAQAMEKFGNFKNYWIGGTIQTVKTNAATAVNIWKWTQLDRLMIFSDWDTTSTTTGNCSGVQFNSLWSAIDCSSKNPFVCQIPAEFLCPNPPKISYCDNGWAHFNFTNSCYKKFAVTTWIDQATAENSCNQENGHLASIHTVEENKFIGNLTSIGYKNASWEASLLWIGAKRNNNSDNWYWTDNSTFDYSNWGHLYDYTNYFCASFWPDYTSYTSNSPLQWKADDCNWTRYIYLCKKPPNEA